MASLELANKWAMLSCPKWCKIPLTRRVYRMKYRKLAMSSLHGKEHERRKLMYAAGNHTVNTYPWPYRDEGFANWEEEDGENYNLISDESGCVIRYATSYCAWKIYELTHKWPKKKTSERLDAKRWVQFLSEAGYKHSFSRRHEALDKDHAYVGVKPDEGEWGLVVWADSGEKDGEVLVTSYVDKKFKAWTVDPYEFSWVLIR